MEYSVKLPVFEGPLDLLLHLIRKNELDIYDIPIALITEQYLEHLDMMRQLNLNVAGEFLVMTATLAYIKSRMLLPPAPGDEEEQEDPRQLLVRQLLEYQRYKQAAQRLQQLAETRRQLFPRRHPPRREQEQSSPLLPGIGVYSLWRAFRRALEKAPRDIPYQVLSRQLSLEEQMTHILARLDEQPRLSLQTLFEGLSRRLELVLIFIAVLELARRRMVSLYQSRPGAAIWIQAAGRDEESLKICSNN